MFQQTGSKSADSSALNSNSGTVIFRLSVNFYTIVTRIVPDSVDITVEFSGTTTGDENQCKRSRSVNSGSI